ncbi:MAG: tyrosine-type recombinase/integrase [Acidimicrobiales bacterium]
MCPRAARSSRSRLRPAPPKPLIWPSANFEGPIFLGANGERLDRHAAWRIVRRLARRAGITKPVGPHTLRHALITAALDAGVPRGTSRRPRRTLTRAPPCATTGAGYPSTGTPPTSWPPSAPAPPGRRPSSGRCVPPSNGRSTDVGTAASD